MLIKSIIKKILPSSLKQKIKKEIGLTTEYTVRVTEQKRFNEKKVLVTGGSGAIGSAICFRLAMEGAIVGVCGRKIDRIQVVIDNISKNGGKAVPIILDVTDEYSIVNGINTFCMKYGVIDILINNAGGSARSNTKSFVEQEFSIIKNVIDINFYGTMLCTHYTLKNMNPNGGKIVNMSSIVGMQGKNGMTDYAAAKAGIVGFTRSLAIELGRKNITVNCISPGWVNQAIFDRGQQPSRGNINCLGHSGKTDDVAALVAFLTSDEAGYITGQNVIIDGGRSLGLWGDN